MNRPVESRRRRSGKHALERRAICRLAVRGQHELDRQVEQRTEPSDDIVARHVLATAELDVQSIAEVGERVAGDDCVDRRQPEDEIVVLAARVRVDAERPCSGTVEVSFAFARAQPGEVLTLHAAHAVGVDAELLDPILPGVCGRRVHREAEPAGVPLVVRRGQDDSGGALAQLVGNGERVEQQEVLTELDRVRRDELGPPLLIAPLGMRRLPMPDTGAQLTHSARWYQPAASALYDPRVEAGVRTGGCLCGAVRYSVRGDPVHVGRCHCADCRKESGSAFTVYGQWPIEAFEVSGEISSYDGRGFCALCGSRLLDPVDLGDTLIE